MLLFVFALACLIPMVPPLLTMMPLEEVVNALQSNVVSFGLSVPTGRADYSERKFDPTGREKKVK
jgi:hypothetical protein